MLAALLLIASASAGIPLPDVPAAEAVRYGATVQIRLNVTTSRLQGNDIPIEFTRRSFNGMPVGPTIRVRPGDTLRIVLDNQLGTQQPDAVGQFFWHRQPKDKTGSWDHDHDVYSHPNYTNLHLHGMHVSPAGVADNVTRRCAPQQQLTYEYVIPRDHSAGTFWYHPHLDQASALQVASGMVGALIVEDDTEQMRGSGNPLQRALAEMEERVLVLHEVSHSNIGAGKRTWKNILCFFCIDDFAWPSGDRLPLNKHYADASFAKCGQLGAPPGTKHDFGQQLQPFDCAFLLINGAYQPELHLEAGVYQRWRIVQSAHQSALRLDTPVLTRFGCDVWLLARDGAYLDTPRSLGGVGAIPFVLPAGARADLAIMCTTPGRYNISSLGAGFHTRGETIEAYEPVIYPRPAIATIVVAAAPAPSPSPIPANWSLPPRPGAMSDLRGKHVRVDRRFTVTYNLTGSGQAGGLGQFKNGGMFSINGLSFRDRPESCMELGTIQEWTVINAHNPLDRWMHSFHIHVNNFQVVSEGRGEPGQLVAESTVGDWRDTVVVPVGGRVVLRMNVTDFTGIFPFHCHVTAHQDLGMMQFVEVAKPGECSTHSA
eukprot:g2895.t1